MTGDKPEEGIDQTGTIQDEAESGKQRKGSRNKTAAAAWAHESPKVDMCLEQLEQGQAGNVSLVGSGRVLVANREKDSTELASRTAAGVTISFELDEMLCEEKEGATVGHVSHTGKVHSSFVTPRRVILLNLE